MPSPNKSGKTITLAKLKGRLKITEAARVNKAAKNSGAKIKTISRMLLVRVITRVTMRISVRDAAWVKA